MQEKSIISSVCWIPKGFARAIPKRYEISQQEIEEMKNNTNNHKNKNDDDELNLNNYDQENTMPIFAKETAMLMEEEEQNNEQVPDDYPLEFEEESDEEKEDYTIKGTDSLLVAAKIDDEFSSLEVYVYEELKNNLFVHHDIMLSAFPLCLEWLPIDPSSYDAEISQKGNYVFVGTFLPEIELWDLDLIDALEPKITLGAQKQSSKKIKKFKQKKTTDGHSDAVICLSLNPFRNNILCSGSADTTVRIWDVAKATSVFTFNSHTDKVQLVKFNPSEEAALLSAGNDKRVCLMDVRKPTEANKLNVNVDIESGSWDPNNPTNFGLSDEKGNVLIYDARNLKQPLFNFNAHNKSATSLAFSEGIQGMVTTTSLDGTIKIWDTQNLIRNSPNLIQQKKVQAKLFCGSYYKDSPWVFACGSDKGELVIWDTKENLHVVTNFRNRVAENIKPKIEECNQEGQDSQIQYQGSDDDDDDQEE